MSEKRKKLKREKNKCPEGRTEKETKQGEIDSVNPGERKEVAEALQLVTVLIIGWERASSQVTVYASTCQYSGQCDLLSLTETFDKGD